MVFAMSSKILERVFGFVQVAKHPGVLKLWLRLAHRAEATTRTKCRPNRHDATPGRFLVP